MIRDVRSGPRRPAGQAFRGSIVRICDRDTMQADKSSRPLIDLRIMRTLR